MEFSDQIVIENIHPWLAGGIGKCKVPSGRQVRVEADIFIHGTETLDARVKYRKAGNGEWKYSEMAKGDNDRWSGSIKASSPGEYEFTIQAWVDRYTGQLRNIEKWLNAGEDTSQDFHVIEEIAADVMRRARSDEKRKVRTVLVLYREYSAEDAIEMAGSNEIVRIFRKYQPKHKLHTYSPSVRIHAVPSHGNFSSWYELFPRSQGGTRNRSGTFRDCEKRLDYVKSLGFDVLYLTPIHPIGGTSRRGKNGAVVAQRGDPGSPWAIGNAIGGHKAINPDLGTLEDFRHLVTAARRKGVEIAMDIAFQCSPDHPYVSQHPDWFFHRPDGSIRYAENPPKKYYDIYPLNFDNPDWKNLWNELKSVFLFWIRNGVRIFRVDNPHTKPFDFWETVLGEISRKHPDVVFLAEAFTRPKVMYKLSKVGFTCSYSYFTWKNFDWEIRQYFEELSTGETAMHFRPVLFTNTPDILTEVLQSGGRPAFMMRAVLAATLSPMWGIYSGYELCENNAVPGTEEYLNSEKYEIKVRNFERKENIKSLIANLNTVRMDNVQLQNFGNVEFLDVSNHNILSFMRWADDQSDPVIVAVNINPYEKHEATLKLPLWKLGLPDDASFVVRDMLHDEVYQWKGENNFVSLSPGERCAHILKIER